MGGPWLHHRAGSRACHLVGGHRRVCVLSALRQQGDGQAVRRVYTCGGLECVVPDPNSSRSQSLAFQDLWGTLKQGKPWMGIVNNRCQNGDHYWVDAYVTPVYEDHQVVGYQSVRTPPAANDVLRAEALYGVVNQGASLWARLAGGLRLGLAGKLFAAHLLSLVALLLAGLAAGLEAGLAVGVMAGVGLVLGGVLSHWIARPWQRAAAAARSQFANDVAQQVYTGRGDELGQLQLTIRALHAKLRTAVGRVDDAAAHLGTVAEQTTEIVDRGDPACHRTSAGRRARCCAGNGAGRAGCRGKRARGGRRASVPGQH